MAPPESYSLKPDAVADESGEQPRKVNMNKMGAVSPVSIDVGRRRYSIKDVDKAELFKADLGVQKKDLEAIFTEVTTDAHACVHLSTTNGFDLESEDRFSEKRPLESVRRLLP